MRCRPTSRLLQSFALLAAFGPGCANLDATPPNADLSGAGTSAEALTSTSELRFGQAGVELLTGERRALHSSLVAASSTKPELVYDLKTKAVLSLGLTWKGGRATARENALAFVATYQTLLDPQVLAHEYVVGTSNIDCGNDVVVLDRVLKGKPVLGSRLTLHFDGDGRLVWVTNGVASVPATVRVVDPATLPGTTSLAKMTGKLSVKVVRRIPVLVPMPDGSGLYEGDLAMWPSGGRTRGAVAVGYTATSRELDASSQGQGRASAPAPGFAAGADTDVPSVMSYRSLGGQRTNFLAGERNPLESAYRYLEEHPTLYRTGAARCQYVPTRFDENPTVPGAFTVRLEQRHGRLPVFGSQLVVGLEGIDTVQTVVARARGNIDVRPTPSVTEAEAVATVRAALLSNATEDEKWRGAVDAALSMPARVKLGILPSFLSRDLQRRVDRLAWKIEQGGFTVVVDALTRQVLWSLVSRHAAEVVKDARARDENSAGAYVTAEINGVAQPGAPAPPHPDVSPGRPGGRISTTMANFAALVGRNGLAGYDRVVNGNVAFTGGGCPNAFFEPSSQTTYFCAGISSVDVVGHELTHQVVDRTSGLFYADQSGAINEAYADLFGNLLDASSAGWRVGEQTTSGAFRDMLNPGIFGHPAHFSAYRARAASCTASPSSCDSGGVHSNSGILNRAHALIADGLAGAFGGIGRERLERLAFRVMTQRLPSAAAMNQVAGATRDVCEMFVARGTTTLPSGLAFTSAHCDSVNSAFRTVGLDPSLGSGWSEPSLGFSDTEAFNISSVDGRPDLTPGRCPVSNIQLQHSVPFSGVTLFADYLSSTPTPPNTAWLDWVATTAFSFPALLSGSTEAMPIGTPVMAHRVRWTSAYGVRPTFRTDVQYAASCIPAPVQLRPSAIATAGWDAGHASWGSSTATLGNPAPAALDARCSLTDTKLELLGGDDRVLDGPGESVAHTVTHWILFVPATFTASARVLTSPPLGGTNLAGNLALNWDLGRTVRVRWRYAFSTPAGGSVDCNPL